MAVTRIEELQTFLAVARLGSFAGAARELGLSTSGVSKQINTLEERLSIRLLNRTTRAVSVTEIGRVFQERGEGILVDLEELESDVRGLQSTPRGTLRVSAPQDFGRLFLCPMIGKFAAEFPELRVEFELTDRIVDVVEEGFDVALRIAEPVDSSLVARKIGICERILCASPEYVEQYGAPANINELASHNCIEYEYLRTRGWPFKVDGERRMVTPTGRLKANAGWAMREMALAGLGIALVPTFLVAADLQAGTLVTLCAEQIDADIALMAVIPHRKQVSAKVRLFIDFMVAAAADGDDWFRRAVTEER